MGVTATSDFDEELDSLVEKLDSLVEELTSPGKVLESLEVSSLVMPGVSSLATPGASSTATLKRCASTSSGSGEDLAITHDMSAQVKVGMVCLLPVELNSLAVPEVSSTPTLARCTTTTSDSDEELDSLLEELDSLLGELSSLGEVLVAEGHLPSMICRSLPAPL